MKKVFLGISLAVVTLIFTNFAWAGDISNNSLDKLMVLSGLNKQIAEFSAGIQAGIAQEKQQNPSISDAEFKHLQKAIETGFQPSKILDTIKTELKNDLSEGDAEYLLSWYESDLGKRITKTEVEASTSDSFREMMENSQRYLGDKDRVWMAKRLDFLMGATDKVVQIQMNTSTAVFSSFSTAMNPEKPVNIEAFKSQISSQEPQVRANTEQFMVLSLAYAYKDIDLANLKKYAHFLEHPIAARFNDSVFKGMDNGFLSGVGEMTKLLKAEQQRAL
jgi:hypothetical protein